MNVSAATASLYEQYVSEMQQIADIRYSAAVLQWDQETYMPAGGADARSRQIATLSEIAHSRFITDSMGSLLKSLSERADLNEEQQKNISLSLYDYEQQVRLPASHIRDLSDASSRAFHSWMDARRSNDFSLFEGSLETLVALKKVEADLLGYENHPYNALLNEYERGATTSLLDSVFSKLQIPLKELLHKIRQCEQVDDRFLKQYYAESDQWQFSLALLERMEFDMQSGRQDKAAHPFTINFSSRDVRITTRIDEQDISNMTWSTIHELGHAHYEQGLPAGQYGLPLGEYASLGIHESQSRLWENNVGRSMAWCEHFMPLFQQHFPSQLGEISASKFYRAINKVTPSLIRTEADELTYHFHVIIRYELEKELIGGQLNTKDIPDFWNQKYWEYLGIRVPDNRQGCLQDVHWSHGSFGYFPTYSLGSLYAAQFFHAAKGAIPDLEKQIRSGNFRDLLTWLNQSIHRHGRRFNSEELCKQLCGEGININYFMQYSTDKYRFIYGFQTEEGVL